jgi:hypothetical protein
MSRAKPLAALVVAFLVLAGLPSPAGATQSGSPSVVLISGPPPLVSTATVTFEFVAAGDHQEDPLLLCRLDSDGLWEACSSPVTYTELADGKHRFEVRTATPGGDCPEPTPLVVRFTVDTTPPQVTIDAAPSGTIGATEATLEFTAEGATSFECRIDSAAADAWRPCTSPVTYTGLAAGPHTIEVRATDAAGNVSTMPAVVTFTVASAAPVPEAPAATVPEARVEVAAAALVKDDFPINGVRLEGVPLSGTVRVKPPGASAFRPLSEGEAIAVGSLVDTTAGKVTLTSIDAAGEAQRASFFGATFRVDQSLGTRLVTLALRGGPTGCGEPGAGASATKSSARSGNALWGSGEGRFRTEGTFGSATVRGKVWLTAETCSGTFFKVSRGVVAVRDFSRGRTLTVPAGKSYLARDPNA